MSQVGHPLRRRGARFGLSPSNGEEALLAVGGAGEQGGQEKNDWFLFFFGAGVLKKCGRRFFLAVLMFSRFAPSLEAAARRPRER